MRFWWAGADGAGSVFGSISVLNGPSLCSVEVFVSASTEPTARMGAALDEFQQGLHFSNTSEGIKSNHSSGFVGASYGLV